VCRSGPLFRLLQIESLSLFMEECTKLGFGALDNSCLSRAKAHACQCVSQCPQPQEVGLSASVSRASQVNEECTVSDLHGCN
jgi:hypothetical protein